MKTALLIAAQALLILSPAGHAQTVGTPGTDELIIAQGGASTATIVVAADAGRWEKQAASDLAKYIEQMSGAKPALAATPDAILAALGKTTAPLIIVGQQIGRAHV